MNENPHQPSTEKECDSPNRLPIRWVHTDGGYKTTVTIEKVNMITNDQIIDNFDPTKFKQGWTVDEEASGSIVWSELNGEYYFYLTPGWDEEWSSIPLEVHRTDEDRAILLLHLPWKQTDDLVEYYNKVRRIIQLIDVIKLESIWGGDKLTPSNWNKKKQHDR